MAGLIPKRTVVPIDFSDLSYAALDRAIEITGDGGEIHVIHVLTELSTMEPGNLYGTVTDEERIKAAEEFLEKKLADKTVYALNADFSGKLLTNEQVKKDVMLLAENISKS